ncbi:hypothetical protein LZG74_19750 [Dyadobacter sp. CY327]|uniref:hypothetical protein n=1 Tax=Dyadobacter sp. CY327 TaxID=2907301 RepID=UPI001F383B19|nr:hypothetical protein [Dyadobacter sp. CY327]MCE7072560.1 hypothetical protein [Dyadobacter sp. CY327]
MLNGIVVERADMIVASQAIRVNKPKSRARLSSRTKGKRRSWCSSRKLSADKNSKKMRVFGFGM